MSRLTVAALLAVVGLTSGVLLASNEYYAAVTGTSQLSFIGGSKHLAAEGGGGSSKPQGSTSANSNSGSSGSKTGSNTGGGTGMGNTQTRDSGSEGKSLGGSGGSSGVSRDNQSGASRGSSGYGQSSNSGSSGGSSSGSKSTNTGGGTGMGNTQTRDSGSEGKNLGGSGGGGGAAGGGMTSGQDADKQGSGPGSTRGGDTSPTAREDAASKAAARTQDYAKQLSQYGQGASLSRTASMSTQRMAEIKDAVSRAAAPAPQAPGMAKYGITPQQGVSRLNARFSNIIGNPQQYDANTTPEERLANIKTVQSFADREQREIEEGLEAGRQQAAQRAIESIAQNPGRGVTAGGPDLRTAEGQTVAAGMRGTLTTVSPGVTPQRGVTEIGPESYTPPNGVNISNQSDLSRSVEGYGQTPASAPTRDIIRQELVEAGAFGPETPEEGAGGRKEMVEKAYQEAMANAGKVQVARAPQVSSVDPKSANAQSAAARAAAAAMETKVAIARVNAPTTPAANPGRGVTAGGPDLRTAEGQTVAAGMRGTLTTVSPGVTPQRGVSEIGSDDYTPPAERASYTSIGDERVDSTIPQSGTALARSFQLDAKPASAPSANGNGVDTNNQNGVSRSGADYGKAPTSEGDPKNDPTGTQAGSGVSSDKQSGASRGSADYGKAQSTGGANIKPGVTSPNDSDASRHAEDIGDKIAAETGMKDVDPKTPGLQRPGLDGGGNVTAVGPAESTSGKIFGDKDRISAGSEGNPTTDEKGFQKNGDSPDFGENTPGIVSRAWSAVTSAIGGLFSAGDADEASTPKDQTPAIPDPQGNPGRGVTPGGPDLRTAEGQTVAAGMRGTLTTVSPGVTPQAGVPEKKDMPNVQTSNPGQTYGPTPVKGSITSKTNPKEVFGKYTYNPLTGEFSVDPDTPQLTGNLAETTTFDLPADYERQVPQMRVSFVNGKLVGVERIGTEPSTPENTDADPEEARPEVSPKPQPEQKPEPKPESWVDKLKGIFAGGGNQNAPETRGNTSEKERDVERDTPRATTTASSTTAERFGWIKALRTRFGL